MYSIKNSKFYLLQAGNNKPLLAPQCGELSGAGARAQGQAADNEKMKTFVQLRQDLERVRNLCYMVNRREKLWRSLLKIREQTFHKQVKIMAGPPLPPTMAAAVLSANHGPSIYDRLLSHPDVQDYPRSIESLLLRISGEESPTLSSSDEKKVQPDFNGASKKKIFFNGSVRRKSSCANEVSSLSSSETDVKPPIKSSGKSPSKSPAKSLNKSVSKSKAVKVKAEDSSTEEEAIASTKSKAVRRKSKKTSAPDRPRKPVRDSSESDKLDPSGTRSLALEHMERELDVSSGSDSDDLLPPCNANPTARHGPTSISAIYSSDSDSQEHASHSGVLITKAAVKEFSAADLSKNSQKSYAGKESRQDHTDDGVKNKENLKTAKKKECPPSTLIVPQRQAAKKASEIMQRSQGKKETTVETSEAVKSPPEEKSEKPEKAEKPVKPVKEKAPLRKQREGRAGKDGKNNDIYDFEKEYGDGSEILAYVPQRQAAKKAAEHIKSGMGAKIAPQPEPETSEVKPKKDSPEAAKKKELRKEESPKKEPRKEESPKKETRKDDSPKKEESPKKPKKIVQENKAPSVHSSNSESSSSSSCSSSSESSSDTDEDKNSTKDQALSSSTSSESDSGQQSKNKTPVKRQVNKSADSFDADKKAQLAGRKLKKLPDKKLKTSDGRHGPEFQPPPTEREEPSRSAVLREQQPPSKKTEHRDATKKSFPLPTQQQQHQHQHEEHQQSESTSSSNQSVHSRSRDNDGPRNLSGPKPTKKSSQPTKPQQTTSRNKEESPSSRAKPEARKRKSSETPQKEEKSSKEAPLVKKLEKRVNDKYQKKLDEEKECRERTTEREKEPEKEKLKERLIEKEDKDAKKKDKDKDKEKDNEKCVTQSPEQCRNEAAAEISSKSDDKKVKKSTSKSAINILEEINQRKAERPHSTKKSSRGLEKLLEKREHLDMLSRNKDAAKQKTQQESVEKEQKSKPIPDQGSKDEDQKNNSRKESTVCSKLEQVVAKRDSAETEAGRSKGRRSSDQRASDRRSSDRRSSDRRSSDQRIDEAVASIQQESGARNKEAPKEVRASENLFSKSVPDKLTVNEIIEKESQKRRRSINQRSIFSPQHGSKDPSVSELFDFDHDLLTDDMVNDDGFSIPRDVEERAPPLSFQFANELWFKEDSKEDSARETLNLVEKLRMGLNKKSTTNQFEGDPACDDELKKEERLAESTKEHQSKPEKKANIVEEQTRPPEIKSNDVSQMTENLSYKNHNYENKQKSCYGNSGERPYVPYSNEDLESGKLAVTERSKLDRAATDERWVHPGMETFNPSDVHAMNALMESQNHRYAAQFQNDIAAAISESNAEALVHSHINMNMQEHYQLLQQTQAVVRSQQHLDGHSDGRMQQVPMMDQQIGPLAGQMVDDITPMEMVNRHLMNLPNVEDQGNEMDHSLEKEDMDPRQDYTQNGSPYDMNISRQDTRWAESQVLPSRRSTSSSITSASSTEENSAIPPYKNIPPIPFPPCSMDPGPYHSYSESGVSYPGAVSLFPPQSCAAPLPYPSPGGGMFGKLRIKYLIFEYSLFLSSSSKESLRFYGKSAKFSMELIFKNKRTRGLHNNFQLL